MKDWQFFLAILFLFILLLPIYEPYTEEDVIRDIGKIKETDKKNNELIGNLTNKLSELRTDQAITKNQISGNTDNLKSLISNTCPSPIPTVCPPNMPCQNIPDVAKIPDIGKNANLPSGAYTLKYKDKNTYCSDFPDQVVCSIRDTIGSNEKMQLINVGDGYYNIKGGRSNQYCGDEGNNIVCNRNEIGPSEKFKIMDVGEGYNLIGKDGKYCGSDNFIKCDKDKPDAMDIIQITPTDSVYSNVETDANVPTGVYSMKHQRTNNYCSDLEYVVSCDNSVMSPGTTDIWKVINLGDGNYNLKGGRANQYCREGPDGRVVCNSDATNATKFKLTETENAGYFKFSTPTSNDIVNFTPFVPLNDPFENNTDVSANLPTGMYTLQIGPENKYCSDLEGGISCTNNVMSPGTSDIWKVINLGDGYYNLVGGRANQYCRERLDGRGLVCDSDATQTIQFKLIESQEVGYLILIDSRGGRARVKLTPYVPTEVPANLPSGMYSLKLWENGKYCTDREDRLRCDKDVVGPLEKLQLMNLGDENYIIKGERMNRYCREEPGRIICDSEDPTQAMKFKLTESENVGYLKLHSSSNSTEIVKFAPYVATTVENVPIDVSTDANVPTGVYTIQTGTKQNYCSDFEQGFACLDNVKSPGTSDIWKVINLGDGNYNLKGGRANQYCADKGNGFVCDTDATQATKYKISESKEEPGTLNLSSDGGGMGRLKFTPYVPSTNPFD